ncbi:hypothetical protein SUGI_0527440 [Cryptomeria japonica]|nr:hypothetical protein SUGI_0527440 [Cryptomeria japonica]
MKLIIKSSLLEAVNACTSRKKKLSSLFSSWDDEIIKKWKFIKLHVKGSLICNQIARIDIKEIRWKPPTGYFSKLNFDGAAHGNPGTSGIECAIRNQEGIILVAGYGRTPNGSNNIVEAKALLLGIKLAIKVNACNLIIEGDSYNILSALLKKRIPNWQVDYIIQEARELIPSLAPYQIVHCYRKANKVADILSNLGCDQDLKKVVLNNQSA